MDGQNLFVSSTEARLAARASLANLEAEIVDLWGHITAATSRFLELLAEFDRAQGWGGVGVASCAHWLNLNCGIGMVAAREKVRVARALEDLPRIAAAFRDGRLSYSKVRAITRVATPDMQDTLLNIALYGTASHVERLVREFRRFERLHEAQTAELTHRERYVRFRYDEDGSMRISARLPAEVGALVERAIEAARAEVEAKGEADQGAPARFGASAETSEEAVLMDSRAARRADALKLLAESFLSDQAERSPSSADRYQVVVHVDQRMLRDAMRDDTTLFARGRSEIEDGPALAVETVRRLGCDGTLVGVVEDAHGNPLDLGRKTRAISPALRRALKARDGGCRFPGCDRTRFTHAHHVEHWADGGETKLPNLITLCTFHHRLVHEGGFGLRATDDGLFVFSTPDGERLSEQGRIERRRFSGNMLPAWNTARGVEPKRAPGWHGERMQYWWAVEAMLSERRVGMQ